MAQPLSIVRDINGYPTTGVFQCLSFTDTAQYFTLTANTIKVVTVPVGNYQRLMANIKVEIETGNPVVWVLPAASPTLTLPSGTVTLTLAEVNPGAKLVLPGQTLQFLTDQTGVSVSITYYIIPT
jgi:hypothetical protein